MQLDGHLGSTKLNSQSGVGLFGGPIPLTFQKKDSSFKGPPEANSRDHFIQVIEGPHNKKSSTISTISVPTDVSYKQNLRMSKTKTPPQ